jgi:hypothetical protein
MRSRRRSGARAPANAADEGCMSIDVRSWHRQRLLCAGQRFSHALTWMGEPTEGVDVVTEVDAVLLIFRSRSWGGELGQIIRQRVPITWTLCALGGRRPWFRCDAYYRGQYCGRRVALLYSGGGPLACRHCRRLKYGSQNETPTFRAINRVRKIRMRLVHRFQSSNHIRRLDRVCKTTCGRPGPG